MKLLAIVAAVLVITAVAPADTLKATANKMLDGASTAIQNKDFKAFDAAVHPYVTAGFKHIENGKATNYAQMLAGMKQSMGMLQHVTSAHARLLSCTEHGQTGTTTTTHAVTATSVGKDKKPHKLGFTGTTKDTWVKVRGAWKITSMTWVSQKMTQDGKPFDPMAGPQMRPKPKAA